MMIMDNNNYINIAIPKGRLQNQISEFVANKGVVIKEESRKLDYIDPPNGYRFLFVKNSDVPVYVNYGVAHMGISGSDVIYEGDFEFMRLGTLPFGSTRICIAGYDSKRFLLDNAGKDGNFIKDIRIATKFIKFTKDFFVNKGIPIEIIKLTGSGSKIIYLPEVTNDPQKRRPDISLAKEKLNWRPRVDFETGLKKTIEYFKERVKNKTNILVFSTVYDDPIEGNLEKNVKDLVREMPNFHFHIIAGKFRSDLPKIHQGENFTIYRVGIGGNLDKYLLALIGPFKAMKLHKSHKFPLAWSIRATYGSLAALIFKFFSKVPFMVLFHQADLAKAEHRKVRLIWPIYKLILKKSGAIHLPDDIFIKEQRSAGDYEIIPFSTESTLEIRKVKEIHHKIIHKLNKKLVKPK